MSEEIEYEPLFDPYAESEKKPKKKFKEYPKDENGNTIWPEQKRKGPRKNPYINFTEDGELIPLTDAQREKLKASAMNSCMWHLGQSSKTKKQLRDKLVLKEIPEDIIEETLERLVELQYVDDENYADIFVQNKQAFNKMGKGAIRQELRKKGIDQETIENALEEISEDDERVRARELVLKKLPSTRNLDRQKRMNRLVGMLSRKGYGGNIVFGVINECLNEEAEELAEEDIDIPDPDHMND